MNMISESSTIIWSGLWPGSDLRRLAEELGGVGSTHFAGYQPEPERFLGAHASAGPMRPAVDDLEVPRAMHTLNVFITVDTEVWPRTPGWRESGLKKDMLRDIYGATTAGEYGLPYQMDVLDAHGLKAVFFVESLSACAAGLGPLREIVAMVQARGHEVQLHIHTEWLKWMNPSILPGRTGQNIKDFTEDEQTLLIGRALENLRAAGAVDACAFRAGNYGATSTPCAPWPAMASGTTRATIPSTWAPSATCGPRGWNFSPG